MIVASVVMIILSTSMVINVLIHTYMMELILDRFKLQEDIDLEIINNIEQTYDIIAYNGLVKPRRNEYDKGSKSNNKEGHS